MLRPQTIIFIPGSAGTLETRVERPDIDEIKGVMIVLHPNPLHGGTNQNKVVQTMLKAAIHKGYIVYAPNFRGVGKSTGSHDFGNGEVEDVNVIVSYIQKEHPNQPISLSGFSFGGYVAIKAVHQFNFKQIILVGAAVSKYGGEIPHLPKNINFLLIHGEKDEVIPLGDIFNWARIQDLPVCVMLDACHFFHGKLIPLQKLVEDFLS
ncbi:MAG: alpha/beta fold hydrolase [Neisseriaceae bacterium]|nr:MAG: alpha/beta fold hydrolase [Neisseriaceae bacterium]